MRKSPYLASDNRLGDVIAGIQVMATYRFYKLSFDGWAKRIAGDSNTAQHWREVFEQHPEFFRLDGEKERASLVWRRQYPKRFHVDRKRELSTSEYEALSDNERRRVSRTPLTSGDIKALIDTAIGLHARALEARQASRWWTALAGGVGSLIGALVGAALGK